MAREDNLISFNAVSVEEHRKMAHNGGIKSGEVRKARKTLREELLLLLKNGDTQTNITIALLKEAEKGNIKAYEVMRDTIGEKPIEKIDNHININNPLNGLTEEELKKLAGE